jgi:hypothetical protein
MRRRAQAVEAINQASDAAGSNFLNAYKEFLDGNRDQATQMWQKIVKENEPYKIMNYVLLSEWWLQELNQPLPPRGKMLDKGPVLNLVGNWK